MEVEYTLAAVSAWHVPRVSAADFADKLGLPVASIRQYVSKDDSFPVPAAARRGKPA